MKLNIECKTDHPLADHGLPGFDINDDEGHGVCGERL